MEFLVYLAGLAQVFLLLKNHDLLSDSSAVFSTSREALSAPKAATGNSKMLVIT